MSTSALHSAIQIAGGQAQLARQINAMTGRPVRQGHVWAWLHRTGVIPAEYAIPIEQITAGKVSRHDLRPDLYPREAA